jgi:hypothetical protein
MSTVLGKSGFRSGSQVRAVEGSLVHACVDLQGRVYFYGVSQGLGAPKIVYFYADTVTQVTAQRLSAINTASEKEFQEVEATDLARRRLAAGWRPNFEEPGDAPDAATGQTASEQADDQEVSKAADQEVSKAPDQEESKNTTWTHEAKMMFYGWVGTLNPFSAARGQCEEAWNNVAAEVAKSTKHLSKKKGRIELSGAALRVYLSKQMSDSSAYGSYKKQLRAESTLSGQAGTLSNHATLEYNLLDKLDAMKKEAQEDNAVLKDEKALLKSIKDNQMNDQIYARAMAKPEFKDTLFKTLNKQRKKLEIKIEALIASNKRPRKEVVEQLDDEERALLSRHDELKADKQAKGETTTDGYDSDDNANRGNQKKSRFKDTLDAIMNLEKVTSQPRGVSEFEKTLTDWLQHKMARDQQEAPQTQDVETRLRKLDEALARKVITDAEHRKQRENIIKSSF